MGSDCSTAALQYLELYLELYWGGEELLFRRDSRAVEGAGVAPGAPGAADLERVLLLRGDITVWELQSER